MRERAAKARRSGDPIAKLRAKLKASPRDVIDHLLVDAPPCDPDEERAVETVPLSPTACALRALLEHVDGTSLLDWSERNCDAMVELGCVVEWFSTGAAEGKVRLSIPRNKYNDAIAFSSDPIPWVESREQAKTQASYSWNAKHYDGWDEPLPPELTAEQAAAIAAEARFQAAERDAVLAGERELAADVAAKAFPTAKKEAA